MPKCGYLSLFAVGGENNNRNDSEYLFGSHCFQITLDQFLFPGVGGGVGGVGVSGKSKFFIYSEVSGDVTFCYKYANQRSYVSTDSLHKTVFPN